MIQKFKVNFLTWVNPIKKDFLIYVIQISKLTCYYLLHKL